MDIYCTRPGCPRPVNSFADLDDSTGLKTVQQKYCITCGMELLLLGRYLPLKLLGQGGFGAAFLARDRYTPGMRRCVVKQFLPSGNLNPNQLQLAQNLFEREAEVLEHLGNAHPQIPDLFAFFEISARGWQASNQTQFFYLVQEFIDGQTMEEELAQKGQFSEAQVLEVLVEILKVLKFVHENGSIHRDIKPSNIMRHCNGKLYLLDFGAVKQATKGGTPTSARSTGIYSLGFAPPEQVSGSEVYPSTDLYALAVTCLILLTGKSSEELFDSYRNTWNWRKFSQVSDRLAQVLDRMLLPTPSDRFPAAMDVLDALTRRTSPATPPSQVQVQSQSQSHQSQSQPQVQSQSQPSSQSLKPVPQGVAIAPFSTLELLGGAAFTGFESALLAIALFSLPMPSLLSAGLWLVISFGLVFAQSRRWIERIDLLIFAGITLALVLFVPVLNGVIPNPSGSMTRTQAILLIAVLCPLIAIAITSLFRLIYKLLSTLL
jgi:serine/threonine protein kinase